MRYHDHLLIRTIGFAMVVVGLVDTAGADDSAVSISEQAGSARRGYEILTTQPFGDGLIEPEDFQNLWRVWPDSLRVQYEQADPESRQALLNRRYGLVANPDRTDGRPLAMVPDQRGSWTNNCLLCHGGKVAGTAIPGLGNSHLAFQTLVNDIVKAVLLGIIQRPEMVRGELQSAGRGPSMFSLGTTNGTTNAQVFSIQLSQLRDNELNVLAKQRRDIYQDHDLDAPPFWNVKKKSRLYIDGFVPKTHRVIMQFVLSPSNSGDTIKSWENDFRDVLAWIESCEPPKYPFAIDTELAEVGRKVFSSHCQECHGSYGAEHEYPERMVDIDQIGTDSVRLTGMSADHRRFYRDSWFGEYGKLEVIEEPQGYVAPPLDGIWASAPYLHNGSVPTLWHLMHSDQRPIVWLRDEDGYDQKRVGLQVSELSEVPNSIPRYSDQQFRYFDTRKPSKSAAGHTFPDQLPEAQKTAVLEYLKTL